jgi:hypothetical protein
MGRSWRYLVTVGTALVVAAAAGVGYATSVAGSDAQVIQACFNTTNGLVRIVADNGTDCRAAEAAIAWNAQGPQGEAGPPGPKGEPGPAGPSDAYSVSLNNEMTIPTALTPMLTLRDLPAGSYVVSASAGLNNLNGPRTVPILCAMTSPGGGSLPTSPVSIRSVLCTKAWHSQAARARPPYRSPTQRR